MNGMKKAIHLILIIAGILCISVAIGLTSYNIYESHRANKQASDVMEKLAYAVSEKDKSAQNSDETPDYITHPDMEMPTVEIDGRRYIGHLEIPNLNLRLPVAAGEFELKTLLKSPALYSGSVYKNNMVIAAHNYNSHFGQLKKLDVGAKVLFIDAEGNVFKFVVSGSETLYPSNRDKLLSEGSWQLTLFTCTYNGKKRFVLRCVSDET
jgi:sortase A